LGLCLGGVAAAQCGSQVGKGDGRQVATVVGAVLGAMVGANVGRDMDEKDRACVGHALELAGVERDVTWTNADNGVALPRDTARRL